MECPLIVPEKSKDVCEAMQARELVANLEKFYKEADLDNSGGLDVPEFLGALKKASFYSGYDDDDLTALHMQIDTNCDGIVDLHEFLDFNRNKIKHNKEETNFNSRLFQLPTMTVDSGYCKKITSIISRPLGDADFCPDTGLRKYVEDEFITMTADGRLTFWSKRFKQHVNKLAYKKPECTKRQRVIFTDMVYIKEREEVAIANNENELFFFLWKEQKLYVKYAIMLEEEKVTTLYYWSDMKRGIFVFGDTKGYVYVFITSDIHDNGIFNPNAFRPRKLEDYNRADISSLLQYRTKDHIAFKFHIFDDAISSVQFIPSLEELSICAGSCRKLVLLSLPQSDRKASKRIYSNPSEKKIFTCVEYCTHTQDLVTGGEDGILRCWYTHKAEKNYEVMEYSKPICFILNNPKENVVLAIHNDQTVCVWSLVVKKCIEVIEPPTGGGIISAAHYNLHNNELILANTNIQVFLGTGTDVCRDMLSSHRKPVCNALYHNIYKQVVSVCQKGEVKVWDVKTGKTVMHFNASPFKLTSSTTIGLNETERKLVTVCDDGRVRFWNFNRGEQLQVLPVTVPTEVTGILCTEDMIFISAKRSNVVYCFDLEGKEPTYLEHDLIQGGITSMALQPKNHHLVTVSGNEIVVIWDVQSLQASFYINSKKGFKVQTCFRQNTKMHYRNPLVNSCIQIQDKLLEEQKDVLKVEQIIRRPLVHCLKSHNFYSNEATILVADKGYISAWSHKQVLETFKVIENADAELMCMETDPSDRILMTGDSSGAVCVRDIENLGSEMCPPPLLHSWKAHNGAVTTVTCNPSCQNFITTGFDCNVKLWTNKLRLVGTFGKDQWEVHKINPDWEEQKKEKPLKKHFLKHVQETRQEDSLAWELQFEVEYNKMYLQYLKNTRKRFE